MDWAASIARRVAFLPVWMVVSVTIPASAQTDLTGSVRLTSTSTTSDSAGSDLFQQQYTFRLFQRVSPYLSFQLGYLQSNLDVDSETSGDSRRRLRTPELRLIYTRGYLSGSLLLQNRTIDSSQTTDFEADSYVGSIAWRPYRGPDLSLTFRDQKNVADPDVFGAENRTRGLGLRASYARQYWTASYVFSNTVFENEQNDFLSDQDSHEVRLSGSRSFFSNRLSTNLSASIGRLARETQIGQDSEAADPIPALQGLYAVNTSPEIGELEALPALIDGDEVTPVSPPVEIGGANTFRNLGVDVAVTQPVNALQVSVDEVSGAGVLWNVYHSRDNLVWESVSGVTSEFDSSRLRYTIRFTETQDRFFKVVNISSNPAPRVLVTEIRALLFVEVSAGEDRVDSDRYRVAARIGYRPIERVSASVDASFYNDQDLADGFIRRDFESSVAGMSLLVGLTRTLDFSAGYRVENTSRAGGAPLDREVSRTTAGLRWRPLPTVDAGISATRSDESDKGDLIQSSTSLGLSLVTDILPTLNAATSLSFSSLDDPFAATSRDTVRFAERLRLELTQRWQLDANFSYTTFGSEPADLPDRYSYGATTSWLPTHYLSFSGGFDVTDQATNRTVDRRAAVGYHPTPKLQLSLSHSSTGTAGLTTTSNSAANLTYRVFKNLRLTANYSLSETSGNEISSASFSLRLFF